MNLILKHIDDDELIRRIDSAENSVAIYAPGVSKAVAMSLCRAIIRLNGAVKIVLDVTQKSVDMGFLDSDAVAAIWTAQQEFGQPILFHLAGIRLSSLFVDEGKVFVYASVAKLMEDKNFDIVKTCPNGIDVTVIETANDACDLPIVEVDETMVEFLCDINFKPGRPLSEIKAEYESKIKDAEIKIADAERKVTELEKRVADAEKTAVEKYKNRFKMRRYEFSVRCQPADIGTKTANIPSMFLVGLGNEMEQKLKANYRLFPSNDEINEYIAKRYKGETIEKFIAQENEIRKRYLLCVSGFGNFVRCCDRNDFEQKVKELGDLGEKVGNHIREALKTLLDNAIDRLFETLLKQWYNSSDPWFKTFFKEHPYENRSMKEIFVAEMKSGANGTDKLVQNFKPEIIFHSTPIDESLTENKKFLNAVKEMLKRRNEMVKRIKIEGMDEIKLEDLIAQDIIDNTGDTEMQDSASVLHCGTYSFS